MRLFSLRLQEFEISFILCMDLLEILS